MSRGLLVPALAAGATIALAGAEISAPAAVSCKPALTILSPRDGETVQAPLDVRYRIRCFHVGAPPYGHMHAWIGPPATSPRIELGPRRQAGVVQLSDPLLSGRVTLTFRLARANHAPVRNRGARDVVHDLDFEGP